ncbi:MAG: multi-component transcriptional regulator, winged helix family [Acidobacteriaceae bacterium]|nr:multi-component transcriptional regulator, winged helix family [Acidobacteriaceae bacterium]
MRTGTREISGEGIQEQLSAIWSQYGASVYRRVLVLELAADAMTRGDIAMDPELDAQARAEAHAIHGELSTFGFADAARISQEIDALMADPKRRNRSEASLLVGLILMLRQELDEITPTPPASGMVQYKSN